MTKFFKWAKDLNFSRADIHVGKNHMKTCLMSLVIREMMSEPQRQHRTRTRTARLSECRRLWGSQNPRHGWWGWEVVQLLGKAAEPFLKQLSAEVP